MAGVWFKSKTILSALLNEEQQSYIVTEQWLDSRDSRSCARDFVQRPVP